MQKRALQAGGFYRHNHKKKIIFTLIQNTLIYFHGNGIKDKPQFKTGTFCFGSDNTQKTTPFCSIEIHRSESISIDVPLMYAEFKTNYPILIKHKLFSFSQCVLSVSYLILQILQIIKKKHLCLSKLLVYKENMTGTY